MRVMTCLAVLVCVLLAPVAFAQTDPCAAPTTTGVLDPTRVVARLVDYNTVEVDGSNRLVGVRVAQFLKGVDIITGRPVQSTDVPRAVWTLVAGATNCYQTSLPSAPLAAGSSYFVAAKSIGQGTHISEWSDPSNPFGPTGTPVPVTALQVIR